MQSTNTNCMKQTLVLRVEFDYKMEFRSRYTYFMTPNKEE